MMAFKAVAVLVAMAAGASIVLALPGVSPAVEAGTGNPNSVRKSDRIDLRPLGAACSPRAWPYYEPRCLRDGRYAGGAARVVRMVSTDRLPPADILANHESPRPVAVAPAVAYLDPRLVAVLAS